MQTILGTIAFIFLLVWAFRLEINTAKSVESLRRIEKLLEGRKGKQ